MSIYVKNILKVIKEELAALIDKTSNLCQKISETDNYQLSMGLQSFLGTLIILQIFLKDEISKYLPEPKNNDQSIPDMMFDNWLSGGLD